LNRAGVAGPGQPERQLRLRVAVFGHSLYFQSNGDRSSIPVQLPLHLRAIIRSAPSAVANATRTCLARVALGTIHRSQFRRSHHVFRESILFDFFVEFSPRDGVPTTREANAPSRKQEACMTRFAIRLVTLIFFTIGMTEFVPMVAAFAAGGGGGGGGGGG